MGLFNFGNKNNQGEERQPGNPMTMMLFRLLAVGYVMWILKDMIQLYIKGGPDAPSLSLIIASCTVFVGCCIWILIASFRQYKRMKAEQEEYNQRVAEEYRLEEEAAARAREEEAYEDYDDYEEVIDEAPEATEE